MVIYLSLAIALVGVLVYALVQNNGKVAEIGRIMFFSGLLAFLLGALGGRLTLIR